MPDVSVAKVAEEMRKPEVADFFAKLIMRTSPKSYAQALGELRRQCLFVEHLGSYPKAR